MHFPERLSAWWSITLSVALTATASAAPLRLGKPLVAYWNFDDEFGDTCADVSGNQCDASPEGRRKSGLRRIEGMFGRAMHFPSRHKLRVPGKPKFGPMPRISLSAWVMPIAWERYNEIFRKEDGGNRVLFSFQENGTILSLGLNVNGYAECDAEVDPKKLLDGDWHHCATTFDGQFMRVYLDAEEIGSLKRPGTIVAGGQAPGCIGSANGGECFQGTMDDLRIYGEALTPEEVTLLHENGRQALASMSELIEANEPKLDAAAIAHWTFNERGSAAVIQEASANAALTVNAPRRVPRTRGVHGNALHLLGEHQLASKAVPPVKELTEITFSAWTRPTDLRGYREIFRQECAERLLFSYQQNGTILSLGLNVGGYEECDARIDPKQVMDGAWHHCAGTFDGQHLRVYLDGREIGSLERSGKIAIRPDVPCFIGSSNGTGEHFQGALDDLRIYSDALPPEQIASLYRSGVESLASYSKEIEKRLQAVYVRADSFAKTLAGVRKALAETSFKLDREVANVLAAKLKSDFPDDHDRFTSWTGRNAIEYVTAKGSETDVQMAKRLVGMLLEYKPLTRHQIAKQTSEQCRQWEEADAISKRFERLCAEGDATRFSPEWIDVMLEAGRRIQFRPYVYEPVAPYVEPNTPETRNLAPSESREVLERDWLHQVSQVPTPERIRDEIQWARDLAERIEANSPDTADFARERSQLVDLDKQAAAIKSPDRDLYFKVREIKRGIMFRNPVVDFDKVLFVDMPFPQGREWRHETRHRLGYQAVPGARLLILDGLSPAGALTQLMPQSPLHGSFWRPDLSFDARKVLFCFKPHNEKSFHLYEINVDGTGLVQLTDGPYDDFDPIYLPDREHIIFSTTRGHTYVRCMPPTNAYVLARCDRDGKNVYLISRSNEPDYVPSVMDDGRVIYTRWEYTDKPLWRAQGLWTVNPDGTNVSTFWGNQSVWPDLLKDARCIPGSRRVMFTGSAHHNWFAGSVAIVDPDQGFNFPHGLTKVTADVSYPESGNGPVDPMESPRYHRSGSYSAYYSPYPLSEQDFLVSANRGGKFVLYLMDVDGNRELIYEGEHNVFHALPLKPRPRPPVIPDRVAWPSKKDRLSPKPGIIYSNDVYQGAPPELRGKAKFLRILNIEHKTYTYWYKRPYLSTGPVVSAVQSEGVKRVIGTVPIEADGSLSFDAPPGRALHFQLLDGRYRALQTMRSFTGVMPGERRGCLGCHEMHSATPAAYVGSVALSRKPSKITPPPWGEGSVSFPRFVQPVLDRYCGKCHQGSGKAKAKLDWTDRPGFLIFSQPYVILTGKPAWGRPYQMPKNPPPGWGIANMIMVEGYDQRDPKAYQTPEPMTRLSYRSKLIDIAGNGKHHGVKVDPISLRKLIAWVDTMCPYRGAKEVREIPDPVFQGVDWLAVRPKIQNAPTIVRPGPVD